jgi:hypothetical protein
VNVQTADAYALADGRRAERLPLLAGLQRPV